MSQEKRDTSAVEVGKAETRTAHSIRFLDPEWDRIRAFADERGLAPPEFVRFATLAAVADGAGGPAVRLAPLIERTFRATYMLAGRMRGEMLDAGRGGELEALIRAARELQDELTGAASE
ncbi:MAG: hypothetical protein OXU75_01760 [Deltaproteobacteria bacterium]|nr:hypothetical protein [Deltaproteobacteria bacterium]